VGSLLGGHITAKRTLPSNQPYKPGTQQLTPGGGGDTLAHMKRLLCVFAHPDDECLGPGGSIAQCAIDGGEVFITTFTAGEAGSIGISKTLAREELGLDPSALGSPWVAASSSFLAFAIGAVVPIFPYFLLQGRSAFLTSTLICVAALFVIGAAISIFTGRNMVYSGVRMVAIGAITSTITFLVGRLIGVTIS